MSWNKKASLQVPKPQEPPYVKWIIALGLTLFFLFYSLYFNAQKDILDSGRGTIITILVATAPLITVLSVFFIKLIFYFKSKNNYEFLENEKKYADKKWEEWGGKGD
ncbi:hypothetical protein [Citrobacter sp. TSA-1]|uniref:hypothetical protein n=1 Tax=Citrobacter sp. TSA-1 TaxID=184912 RepID=UPI000BAE355B|nr:hypothetical protein [Citrobacter sp. TSA-1]PAX79647.1 hypothetical protein CIK43_11590 [Citrobacter sp. TSA-1]QKE22102.1 hypothetical protein HF677_021390 [Citrobacter sp. TSA-1]